MHYKVEKGIFWHVTRRCGFFLASCLSPSSSSDLQLLSAVTAVQRVAETLPHFQSPYLVAVLLQVCRLSANGEEDKSQLNLRLSAVAHQLASKVAARLLLPAFGQAYDAMADSEPVRGADVKTAPGTACRSVLHLRCYFILTLFGPSAGWHWYPL